MALASIAQLTKSGTEHGEQVALFAWVNIAMRQGFANADAWAAGRYKPCELTPEEYALPMLKWLHAIPNGGKRDKITAANMKAEGVKSGVLDVFFPWPIFSSVGRFAGLYIEMKKPGEKGATSTQQKEFITYANQVGYRAIVCDSWREAANAIIDYVNGYQQTS